MRLISVAAAAGFCEVWTVAYYMSDLITLQEATERFNSLIEEGLLIVAEEPLTEEGALQLINEILPELEELNKWSTR